MILPPEEMQSMDKVIGKKCIEELQEQLPEVTVVKEVKDCRISRTNREEDP